MEGLIVGCLIFFPAVQKKYISLQKIINNKNKPIMKTKLFLLTFVAAMLALSGCGKEETSVDDMADNTVEYNGQTYSLDQVSVGYFHEALTLVTAATSDTLEDGMPKLMVDGIHIMPDMWNTEFDLTDMTNWPEGSMVILYFSGAFQMNYNTYKDGGTWMEGLLDSVYYENESIFTSGTEKIVGNNDGTPITITVDGELKNGKTLRMKIVTPSYQVK